MHQNPRTGAWEHRKPKVKEEDAPKDAKKPPAVSPAKKKQPSK
jgi:hypothetical protein